jgi:hypothetical protein
MSDEGHALAREGLGKSRGVVEDLLRQRVGRGMSNEQEEHALEQLDASYLWLTTETIALATEIRSRR